MPLRLSPRALIFIVTEQGELLSDLWILNLPDPQDPDVGSAGFLWTRVESAHGPILGRTCHALVPFGSKLALLGGNFGTSVPDKRVYILNTSETSLPIWENEIDGTPSAFAGSQATSAVGSLVYVFGGNTVEADWEDNPLRVAQASVWYEAPKPRTECRRMPFVPAQGICTGSTIVIASCSESVEQLTSQIREMELEEANETLSVAKGPVFYQAREQCWESVSRTCMALKRDVMADPYGCSSVFLCSSDSMYTSWYINGINACSDRHNSQCSNTFVHKSELCCDIWMAMQQMNCMVNLTLDEGETQAAADAVLQDSISLGYCSNSPTCYSLCPENFWLNKQGLCERCTDCVTMGLFPAQRCSRLADAVCMPLGEAISAAKHQQELIIPKGR